jgi:hypothetical protein
MATLSSVEPSSTTIASQFWKVWAVSDSSVRRIVFAEL